MVLTKEELIASLQKELSTMNLWASVDARASI
jgi:hypothetical protein